MKKIDFQNKILFILPDWDTVADFFEVFKIKGSEKNICWEKDDKIFYPLAGPLGTTVTGGQLGRGCQVVTTEISPPVNKQGEPVTMGNAIELAPESLLSFISLPSKYHLPKKTTELKELPPLIELETSMFNLWIDWYTDLSNLGRTLLKAELEKKQIKKEKENKGPYMRGHSELSSDFLDYFQHKYKHWYEGAKGRFWLYDTKEGIWKNAGKKVFQAEALAWKKRQPEFRKSDTSFLAHCRARLCFLEQETTLPEPELRNLIPLQNGVWDFEDEQLREYKPEYYFVSRLNFNYVESKPAIEKSYIWKLMSDWVEKPIVLLNLISFAMLRYQPKEQFFILAGGGDNGKSTFFHILERIFGLKNICSVSPKKIQKERFGKVSMVGKYVNLSPEISPQTWKNTEAIKEITGNASIETDRKFQDILSFRNYATMIMSANRLPGTIDHTHGFYRRLNVIQFNNLDGIKLISNLDEIIKNMKKEIDEFASWAVENISQLKEENWKVLDKKQSKKVYALASSPYKFFFDEFLREENHYFHDGEVQKKRPVYLSYERLVENSGYYMEKLNQREQRYFLKKWGVVTENRGGTYGRGFVNCFLVHSKIPELFRDKKTVAGIMSKILNKGLSGEDAINEYLIENKRAGEVEVFPPPGENNPGEQTDIEFP